MQPDTEKQKELKKTTFFTANIISYVENHMESMEKKYED